MHVRRLVNQRVESQIWGGWNRNYVFWIRMLIHNGLYWKILMKTVAGKTEDIYKDDEEGDDPMECYDESDRLYFKSVRK